jgi:membrane-bound lytic murein transglycosylase B
VVIGSDVPLVAVDAYVRAAAATRAAKPACGIAWHQIAAVGRIESNHGRYKSTLSPFGQTDPRILGPRLDGTNNTLRIPDTDGGALDGDTELDRAVGPMQFLPQTWASFRRDGNGDGRFDPDNLYDASVATGAYLCATTTTMTTEAGMRKAYLAYNRSQTYNDDAVGFAAGYRAVDLPGLGTTAR